LEVQYICKKTEYRFMKKPLLLFALWVTSLTWGISQPALELDLVASGFAAPIGLYSTDDDRLFVVEKDGRIQILYKDGTRENTPFLDIDGRVNSGAGERGLLGLTFDPDYTNNGFFYVHYTDNSGASQISRFSVSADNPNIADPDSELEILNVSQPFSNHNAGDLDFGPDGYLYFGMGDGGSGGDPGNRSQNRQNLLGKILRIDVSNATPETPYTIPETNPFAFDDFTLDEIWAIGLRNPWRISFDRETGDLWIADVGQNEWEEVNFQAADSPGGENYGWRCYEGFDPFNTSGCDPASAYTDPLFAYPHQNVGFCTGSITGGYVYRGADFPSFTGYYFYADYCTGKIYGNKRNPDGTIDNAGELLDIANNAITSFGEDNTGELYLIRVDNGGVYRLVVDCAAAAEIEIVNDGGDLIAPDNLTNYQWFRDGELIEGETGNTLMMPGEGEYTLQATNPDGCAVSSNAVVILSSTNELAGIEDLQIRPNPFSTTIELQFTATEAQQMQIQLLDVSGRLIKEDRISAQGATSHQLDTQQLPAGEYLVRLQKGNQSVSRKVIKQ
jgi:glucose/arabinose dehydrogenase